jgi:hypothetical protein
MITVYVWTTPSVWRWTGAPGCGRGAVRFFYDEQHVRRHTQR